MPHAGPTRTRTSSVAGWWRRRRSSGTGFDTVRAHTVLREEQAALATFALVPDRDMAGARGVAIAAAEAVRPAATPPAVLID